MPKTQITAADVRKIGQLASLSLTDQEVDLFAAQFQDTIAVVDELNEIDTDGVALTSQVNHLENITRPDKVDKTRILSQAEALSNAKRTHQGYFVVNQILAKDSE